ncbi:hypothetical protein RRG08_050595 [Elysia crispata]|uniref:Uncharacterized protein n=1 Tax=Elysia crispata TaxID=231223 RepID=A0AAE1DAW3_9GAST|nr:hypothetical protein RRG08_050595 [Elysia crispata]
MGEEKQSQEPQVYFQESRDGVKYLEKFWVFNGILWCAVLNSQFEDTTAKDQGWWGLTRTLPGCLNQEWNESLFVLGQSNNPLRHSFTWFWSLQDTEGQFYTTFPSQFHLVLITTRHRGTVLHNISIPVSPGSDHYKTQRDSFTQHFHLSFTWF